MPGGRPTTIDVVIDTRPDGTPVTTADRIIETVRAGGYLETAAARAGVPKGTVYGWLTEGARASRALHAGTATPDQLTAYQRRCLEFSEAVDRAMADSETEDLLKLRQLGQGGIEVRTVTVKVDDTGREVERTEKVETLAPSAQVLEWRLERRFGQRWGRRQQLEVSGPEGGPLQVEVSQVERARALAEQLQAFKARTTLAVNSGSTGGS